MKRRPIAEYVIGLTLLTVGGVPHGAAALTTAFTYQGQLQQSGSAANGLCDFELSLWDALGAGAPPAGGNQIGGTQTVNGASVADGVFTLQLDFGAAAFGAGSDRWLQIAVRCPTASGSYQMLAPRQPLTPAPFALFAGSIADGSVSTAKLAPGAVNTSQLATNAVTAAQIADGTITMNDLANGAVSTAKIGDGQVTAAKLSAPLSLTSTVAHSFVGAFDGISTGLNSVGVSGTANNGSNAYGVYGLANAGYGVVGSTTSGTGVLGSSTSGTGVLGQNLGNPARGIAGTGAGVVGESDNGEGVRGTSSNGVGVFGQGSDDAGVKGMSNVDGVHGRSTGDSGAGVHGIADEGQQATGVRGDSSDGAGVFGQSGLGVGVAGISAGGDGVIGISAKTDGTGVHGTAHDGVQARGVFGESDDGAGVSGQSTDGYGVTGRGPTGVIGVADTSAGSGVVGVTGLAVPDVAAAIGVHGAATNGVGVRGESTSGVGVSGKSTSGIGMSGESTSNVAVRGESTSASGVFGTSTNFIGVYGKSTQFEGVHGEAANVDHGGVVGVHTGSGIAVFGTSSGTGVQGNSTTGNGVIGAASGNNGIGVHGVAHAGSNALAVYGESGQGYAGYFSGKVSVTGTLTAGVKPFKIDHPLDPANKYLMHAAVESPDMKNIYDGIAVLDAAGEAVVDLPVWFEALNRDFRYQLTCIGGAAPVYLAEEVSDHHFRIAGGTSGLKVSWQVTGIRKDAFANAHPLVVELEKAAEERGRYLYPVEAGMPASLSVDSAKQAVAQTQVQ